MITCPQSNPLACGTIVSYKAVQKNDSGNCHRLVGPLSTTFPSIWNVKVLLSVKEPTRERRRERTESVQCCKA